MKKYKMEIIPNIAEDGSTYWTVKFPAISGCVGCGDTPEEAIAEANENLEDYLDYLKEEGIAPPKEIGFNQDYSGKIALRLSKSTHQKVAEAAEREGISINSLISSAVEYRLGMNEYDYKIDKKIETLQSLTGKSIVLQQLNAETNAKILNAVSASSYVGMGGNNE